MNYRAKFIVLLFTLFMLMSKGYSQNTADPGITTVMGPSSVVLGSTGILSANVGNYGNHTIVANSLRVTISVGINAEILGIAPGSDSRWTQLNLTTGSGNTILLTNSAGGFNSSDVGYILLTVIGNVVSSPDLIQSNIVYITAANSLLCGVPNCSPIPLNVSQGNTSTSNDNSQTSLAVTATTTINAVDDIGVALNGFCGGIAFTNVLGNDTLNGAAVVPNDVNTIFVSSTNAGITLTDTNVIVAAGTPAGSYTLTYQICQISNPTNCETATVFVTVFGQTAGPTVSFIQPTCQLATGTITVTAPLAVGLTYSVNGSSYQSSPIFAGLAPNSYNVTVNSGGDCVSSVTVTEINLQPTNCNNAAGIFHTNVSCSGYTNNASSGLIGQLCYTTKLNKVSNVTPGQFFYYSNITAPSASFCVDILETKSCNGLDLFSINRSNQVFLFNANCLKVATGIQVSVGHGRICITNATPGTQYVLAVKYNSKSIIGSTFTGIAPVCRFTFQTKINGISVAGSTASIDLVPNCSSTDIIVNIPEPYLDVTLAPNPSSNDYGLQIKSLSDESITIRIIDLHGRIIRQFNSVPQETIRFGSELAKGLYLIEVIQGDKREMVKAQKI